MFERFTAPARTAVVAARDHAAALRADGVGPVHLLLALAQGSDRAGQVLRDARVDAGAVVEHVVREGRAGGLDAEALAALGVDLHRVREHAEAVFGQGALDDPRRHGARGGRIPFTAAAQQALGCAVRAAQQRGRGEIDGDAVLRGVLVVHDPTVGRVLRQLGVDAADVLALLDGPART